MSIQLEGGMLFADTEPTLLGDYTDVSGDLNKLVLHLSNTKVPRKPNYANARATSVPGAATDTIEIVTDPDSFSQASTAYAILLAAQRSRTPVWFSAKYEPGAAGPTNLRFEGSFYVDSLDFGAAAGESREMTVTYDIITLSEPLTADPAAA